MVKHIQTIRRQFADDLPTNCLSVFDRFVGLVLRGLRIPSIALQVRGIKLVESNQLKIL